MGLWERIKPKFIGLMVFNVLVWTVNTYLYPLPVVFKGAFTVFTVGGFLVLVLFDLLPVEGWEGTRIYRNLGLTLLYLAIFVGIMWFYATYYEFPRMFKMTLLVYTGLAVLFLILMDLKPLKERTGMKGLNSTLLLFFVMSVGYTAMGRVLPQFDPAYEIDRLKPQKFFIEEADEKTILEVGERVFRNNDCFNCHDIQPGPIPKRGPALASINLGDQKKIRESIVDPRKETAEGYEKEARTMPDYYGEQIDKNYLEALVRYLETVSLREITTEKMPEGWWTDPKVLKEGYEIYEGTKNPKVACHACHGKEGIPILQGARDFRDVEKMGKLSDADFFKAVSQGIKGTAMPAWDQYLSVEEGWKVIAYIHMFHHGGKAKVHEKGEVLPPIPKDQPVVLVIPE